MDESSDPWGTIAEARQVFRRLDDPGAPLTTDEVAAELDCADGVVDDELETLAERGVLKRRQIGTDDCVWWRPAEQRREHSETATETRQDEEHEAFVHAIEDYAIFVLGPDGHVETWNRGAERIKGYETDEILGEHVSTFYPDDRGSGRRRSSKRPPRRDQSRTKAGAFERTARHSGPTSRSPPFETTMVNCRGSRKSPGT